MTTTTIDAHQETRVVLPANWRYASEYPRLRLFTRNEYHRAAELGVFEPEEKLELIDGEIITVSPISSQHSSTVYRVAEYLGQAFGEGYYVPAHQPIALSDLTEPEPDVVVAVGTSRTYDDRQPTPAEIVLAVEVADSSLIYDRTRKAALYSSCGIPEYWIVNLQARQIEVFSEPSATGYQLVSVLNEGQIVATLNAPEAGILAAELLPMKRQSDTVTDV